MKKILLLLIVSFNFLFAVQYVNFVGYVSIPDNVLNACQSGQSLPNTDFFVDYKKYHVNGNVYGNTANGNAKIGKPVLGEWAGRYYLICRYRYNTDKFKSYKATFLGNYIKCSNDQIIYNDTCYDIGSIADGCPANTTLQPDINGEKDTFGNIKGVCTKKCVKPDIPQNPDPNVYYLYNVDITVNECISAKDNLGLSNMQYLTNYDYSGDPNCPNTTACYLNTSKDVKCLLAVDWRKFLKPGYIMKGFVSNALQCSNFVHGLDYIDFYLEPAFPDCPDDDSMYCFLQPSLDNNDTGVSSPDENDTLPDGSLIGDTVPDINISLIPDINDTSQINYNNQIINDKRNTQKIVNALSVVANSINNKSLNVDMSGVESRIDFANLKLDEVKSKIDSTNSKLDNLITGNFFSGDLSFDRFTDFYNNLQTDLDTIKTSFDDTKAIIDNGFEVPEISRGENPAFTTSVFGHTLTFDLCSSFSIFKPVLYFIFSFVFLLVAIRIFWAGFKIKG